MYNVRSIIISHTIIDVKNNTIRSEQFTGNTKLYFITYLSIRLNSFKKIVIRTYNVVYRKYLLLYYFIDLLTEKFKDF